MFEDPDFGQRYVDRWSELRTNVFAASNLLARIDAWAAFLQEPAARNFARWPILGQPVGPESFDAKTFEENAQHLRSWITNRLGWIDAQFPPAPVAVSSNGLVALSLPAGAVLATGVVRRIVFTLDGTDPRQPGGAVSPTARAYDQPFPAAPAAPIFARLQEAERWSGPLRVKFDPPLSASKVP